MIIKKIILLCLLKLNYSYILPQTVKEWHCINFEKNIDKTKPYKFNIGELELISWFDKNKNPLTTINICKHMGSKLDKSKLENNCLVCPYHGLKYTNNDTCGNTIFYQDKLWWSYKPYKKIPYKIPLYNNKNYKSLLIEKDIEANIVDCMINILDLNYHKILLDNLFNIKLNINDLKIVNKDSDNMIGIKFKYNNFNIYYKFIYPYTAYYFININKNKFIVTINLLPLNYNKTRWFINIRHNNYKSFIINLITKIILNENEKKLLNISKQSIIKNYISYNFDTSYKFIYNIKQKYMKYLFPDNFCIENFIKNLKFY